MTEHTDTNEPCPHCRTPFRDGWEAGEQAAVERIAAWLEGRCDHGELCSSYPDDPWCRNCHSAAAIRRGDWRDKA